MNSLSMIFEISTAEYLGSAKCKKIFEDAFSSLPKRLKPTRCISSSSSKVSVFGAKVSEIISSLIPGSVPYEGDIRFYAVPNCVDISISWRCGSSEWIASQKKWPLNQLIVSVSQLARNDLSEVEHEALMHMWRSLCVSLSAVYGYVYLADETQGATPRGEGLCMPRLHWCNFFGNAYSTVLKFEGLPPVVAVEAATGGVFLMRNLSPDECIEPTDAEQILINILGADYFWKKGDSWRLPRGPYSAPVLDFSSLNVSFL